jgi:hypothetical protein
MKKTILVLCALWLVPVASHSAATTPPHRSSYNPALIQQWKDRLHTANEQLQAGDWKHGYDIADSVLREMRDRISGGDAASDLLAVALLFRALGESGLGRTEDAAWDFSTAQSFYPAYEKLDLKPYGPAGTALESARFKNGVPSDPELPDPKNLPPGVNVTPPERIDGERPIYPYAKAISCAVAPPIDVKMIINKEGRTASPAVFQGADPVLALAALDALRKWRFKPAQLGDRPVSVFYVMTINFKVRQCY